MRTLSYLRAMPCILGLLAIALVGAAPAYLAAQATGSIEFTAHVSPTDARPEPVRQVTFYLLRESLASVRQEAAKLDPPPDLGKFVDSLKVSPELKAWMKKHHTVQLSGTDFTKSLAPDEIVNVPEFFKAYMARSGGFQSVGFPSPKFKEKDRTANPEKYKKAKDDYTEAIRKFIVAVPDSAQGIDADLTEINPSGQWTAILAGQKSRLDKRTLELAQTSHLAAQTDTNLDGRGAFGSLAPGDYWLGTLGKQAMAGDVRLRWDVRVTVRPGEVTRVELTNLNAMEPENSRASSNQ